MGEWQFTVIRPGTWEVLDRDPSFMQAATIGWPLDAPAWATAIIPAGSYADGIAQDGQAMWQKWNTIVLVREDGVLKPPLICVHVEPDKAGTELTFVGFTGWLQGVPFTDVLSTWERNVFWVVRQLVDHALTKTPNLPIDVTPGASAKMVGDPEPPNKPRKPNRNKNESKNEYQNSTRYENWEQDMQQWENNHGDKEKYRLGWWEAAYVGEEIDTLAKETGFNYREDCIYDWELNGSQPVFYLTLSDNLQTVRNDIKLVNGENMSKGIEAKEADLPYATQVIGLGAGEGPKMRYYQTPLVPGTPLYQGQFIQYKAARNKKRLRELSKRDLRKLDDTYSAIDTVEVWDMPGHASISSLKPGDVVEIIDQYAQPTVQTWRRIVEVVRSPVGLTAEIRLEVEAE